MTETTRVERLAAWLVDHPKTLAMVVVTVLAVSFAMVPRLKMQAGFEALTDRSQPEQKVLDEVTKRFVGDNFVVIVYQAEDVFSHASLSTARWLGDSVEKIRIKDSQGQELNPIGRVDSLTHTKDLVGADMTFRTALLVPDPIPQEAAALEQVRKRALFNPLIKEGLLSENDPTLAMMVVRLVPDLSDEQNSATVKQVHALVDEAKARGGMKSFYLTGTPTILAELGFFMEKDLGRFIPALVAALFVLMLVCLRRLPGALLAFVNMIAALIVGLALFPLLGRYMTNWSVQLAPVVLVLSTAVMIHFLTELGHHAEEHQGKEAIKKALADLLIPSAMTMCATIVGFGTIAISRMPALQDFGLTTAVAIVTITITTYCIAILAALWKPPHFWVSRKSLGLSTTFNNLITRYSAFVLRRPLVSLSIAVAMLLAAVAGLPRIQTDSNLLENLGHQTPVRAATDLVDEKMGGAGVLVISLKHSESEHFLDPAALQRVEKLEEFLKKEVGAKVVTSAADYVKLMHRGFFGEDPNAYKLPENREQTAQLLLLNSDESFTEYLDPSRSWTRVVMRYSEHSVARQNVLFTTVDSYLRENFPASQGYEAHATGDNRMLVNTITQLVDNQMGSLGLAFVLIFGPIFLVLRSVRAGMFSIPSNLFPVAVILGLMGWWGVPLNEATSMIASIVLGIVVDDTIHFLQFLRSRIIEYDDTERALKETLKVKGAGVSISTVVFSMGFAVLLMSQFPLVAWFGLLTALAILLGWVSELMVLPPLIVLTKTRLGVPLRQAQPEPAPTPALGPQP